MAWFLYDRDLLHERVKLSETAEALPRPPQASEMENSAAIVNDKSR